jgi:hypothetical protein
LPNAEQGEWEGHNDFKMLKPNEFDAKQYIPLMIIQDHSIKTVLFVSKVYFSVSEDL